MSALLNAAEPSFEPMTEARLGQVVTLEQRVYDHPWTHGNFVDALRAGYHARMLFAGTELLGYFVAMKGVDEVHLLNLTVAPEHQGRGWGRLMLDALAVWSRGQSAQWLWLEVRASNVRAQRLYEHHGYQKVGERRHYYPAVRGRREDAVVMSLKL
ncbi:MAG TPA: ribosomal protein S18-alanine N-acetyltransferase [Ramlibacter sp.]|nr:ribosomal protein S18-alanine N-acetyltransferase [Ramlibacter sp.]